MSIDNNEEIKKFLQAEQQKMDVFTSNIPQLWIDFMEIAEHGKKFVGNWHVDYLGEYIKNVIQRKSNRIIFNMPPGHGKTTLMITMVALYMGFHPRTRFLIFSCTEEVREKYASFLRSIINSDLYKAMFPNIEIDEDGKDTRLKFGIKEFNTPNGVTGGGTFTIKSLNSKSIGADGDFILFDDPIDPSEYQKRGLAYVIEQNSVINQLMRRDRGMAGNKSPVVITMQRICEGDPSEDMIKKFVNTKWDNPILPVVETEECDAVIESRTGAKLKGKWYKINNYKKFRKCGEYLFEKMLGEKDLEEARNGFEDRPIDFLWQFYQRADNSMDATFDMDKIHRFDIEDVDKMKFDEIIQSWDTSQGRCDYQVCTTWGVRKVPGIKEGVFNIEYYLIDIDMFLLPYTILFNKDDLDNNIVLNLIEKWNPDKILIEDKSTGSVMIEDLEMEVYGRVLDTKNKNDKVKKDTYIIAMKTPNSKEMRADGVANELGKVFIPHKIDKYANINGKKINVLIELLNEMRIFPKEAIGIHDDAVDSLVHFLTWAKREYRTKKVNTRYDITFLSF